jgi:topoisomerase IA-like protein
MAPKATTATSATTGINEGSIQTLMSAAAVSRDEAIKMIETNMKARGAMVAKPSTTSTSSTSTAPVVVKKRSYAPAVARKKTQEEVADEKLFTLIQSSGLSAEDAMRQALASPANFNATERAHIVDCSIHHHLL